MAPYKSLGSMCHLVIAALVCAHAAARSPRTLRVCTTPEPGFNEFTAAARVKYVAAGTLDASTGVVQASVGERGLIVPESDMKGYMHDQRELMFTGKNDLGQSFDAGGGNLWLGDLYTLHVFPSYGHLNYYTRVGFCDIGWGPVTVKPSREACTVCPATPAAMTTVSLAPDVANNVVALANVSSAMSCCLDFPQTTVATGMAVAFKKFKKTPFYLKTSIHNIFIMMFGCIILFAHVSWFFERHSNTTEFPLSYLAGVEEALWFSGVTVTAGCGDKSPNSAAGRFLTFVMFLGGIVLTSLFTAVITSELAADKATSDVTSISDFDGKIICSTGGYWNSDPLIQKSRKFFGGEVQGTSMTECMELLLAGKVHGVYYDRPPMEKTLLDKHVAGKFLLTPDLLPLQLTPVFPDAFNPRVAPAISVLRNEYNELVLVLAVKGKLQELYEDHFAGMSGGSSNSSAGEEVLLVNEGIALLVFIGFFQLLGARDRWLHRKHKEADPNHDKKMAWEKDKAWLAKHFKFHCSSNVSSLWSCCLRSKKKVVHCNAAEPTEESEEPQGRMPADNKWRASFKKVKTLQRSATAIKSAFDDRESGGGRHRMSHEQRASIERKALDEKLNMLTEQVAALAAVVAVQQLSPVQTAVGGTSALPPVQTGAKNV
jgi:hypothetical protein